MSTSSIMTSLKSNLGAVWHRMLTYLDSWVDVVACCCLFSLCTCRIWFSWFICLSRSMACKCMFSELNWLLIVIGKYWRVYLPRFPGGYCHCSEVLYAELCVHTKVRSSAQECGRYPLMLSTHDHIRIHIISHTSLLLAHNSHDKTMPPATNGYCSSHGDQPVGIGYHHNWPAGVYLAGMEVFVLMQAAHEC